MMSTDIAVVVVLMVLRTAAYPGTTIETTTETTTGTPPPTPPPPTVCPVMLSCTGNCNLDYSNMEDGCPTCLCDEATCEVMRNCGPDEVCGSNDENPYDIICVSKYGTTTETTTETTTHRPTCRPIPCNYPQCYFDYDSDGCAICVCPNCEFVICPPGEYCVEKNENQCQGEMCYSCVSMSGTTTETTTETTTGPPTPRVCPDMSSCYANCNDSFIIDGCPMCGYTRCDSEQECLPSDEDPSGYACVVFPGWGPPPTRGPTTYPTAIPTCTFVSCGPDEECVPNNENPSEYTCVSKYDTTTYPCPPVTVPPSPGCIGYTDENGCLGAHCYTCDDTSCDGGQKCVLQEPCFFHTCPPGVSCIYATDPTPGPTETPTPLPVCTQSKLQEAGTQNHCSLFENLEARSQQRQATSVKPVIYYNAYQWPYKLETLYLF